MRRFSLGLFILFVCLTLLALWHGPALAQVPGGGALFITASSPGHLHASVEILVIDPGGRKTGFDPVSGKKYLEIPRSGYGADSIADDEDPSQDPTPEEKSLEILQPASGSYLIQLIATGTGPYALDLLAYDVNDGHSSQSFTGTASPGVITTYQTTYSSAPGAQVRVVQVANKVVPKAGKH